VGVVIDIHLPDHRWSAITRHGAVEPVAYVCQECGERRPRGTAIVFPGRLSEERRVELEWAGFDVVESSIGPTPDQIVVCDGRIWPSADDMTFCPGTAAA